MSRKTAREAAMSLLYQKIFSNEYNINELQSMSDDLSLDEKDIPYVEDIVEGFFRHQEEIDGIIQMNSRGWKFERISKVDLSILRLALYEILYRDDIPVSVSVNEAVELAKKYGGDKSGSFINGILGNFIRSRNNTNNQP